MESNNIKFSGIELYFSPASFIKDERITVYGEEARHILTVMRHIPEDEIFITNGEGSIFKTRISNTTSEIVEARILEKFNFTNYYNNIYFCLPRLKSPDRFESALEKCTELGITHFMIYDSERAIPRGNKKERWEKILLSAMKQSLRSFLPDISFVKSLYDIKLLKGKKILFLQEAGQSFNKSLISKDSKYYFIFGPEGDLTEGEKNLFKTDEYYNLGDYRLRSETAIIKCASLL